jgi:ABC-type branched-subunit amino acid transport system substrate-binding protein
MKNNYLLEIQDEEIIRLILEEFPGEFTLTKRLVNRKLARKEYEKAHQIIEQYGLNAGEFHFPQNVRQVIKDQYRVAAIFPFLADLLEPSPGNKFNQSALDLYQGMVLANDSLSKAGIIIELVSYDTERKVEKVEQLMNQDEMKSLDVLIGPLFSDELKPVAEFSVNNNVPVINPISNSFEFIRDNPNALLLQPDYRILGEASAESLSKRKLKRPCVVLYGDTPKDSILAASFLKRAKELEMNIAFTRYVTRTNSSDVWTTLVTPTKYDKFKNPIEFQLKRDSIGSIFVASDNELIFTKVISSVDRRADSVIVVGMDTWLEKPGMDFDKFERLHIMMSSPEYSDVHSEEFRNFRNKYISKYGVIPSSFAKNGFESMMLIGLALKEHGVNFISKLQQQPSVWGILKRTYNFQDSQCNKKVPFVIFEYGELRLID